MSPLRPFRWLCALGVLLAPGLAGAQATLRPIPAVARAWERRAVPAAAPAPADLDFIGPPRVERPAPPADAPGGRLVELEVTGEALEDTGLGDAGASVGLRRGGWRLGFGRVAPSGLGHVLEVGTEGSLYAFSGAPLPGTTDPFNDVYETRVAARLLWRDAELELYGGLELGTAGEDAADLADALFGGGALAVRYAADPDLALIVGVAAQSRFDDSPWVLPYVGFDWDVTERLNLRTEAAEVHAGYRATESLELGLEAVYDFHQYRLNDDGPLRGGSVRDDEVRGGASLAWRPREGVTLELAAGKVLWRELRFHDGQAGFLGEFEADGALYLRAGLHVGF